MLRTVLAILAGFFAWLIMWFAGEMILSALWPDGFGVPQRAFQEAIEKGGPFTAETTLLLVHLPLAALVSLMSGFLCALIAGENKRAPLILGALLMALGLLKAAMSWPYVPLWYHIGFTGVLIPMAILGGRLKPMRKAKVDTSLP